MISLWHDDTVWGDRRLRGRIARLALLVRNVRIFGAAFSLPYIAAGHVTDGGLVHSMCINPPSWPATAAFIVA